jgi:hypothetical protein
MSLRDELNKMFPNSPEKVKALVQEYHNLTLANPGWRIGGFISLIKAKGTGNARTA